MKESSGVRWRTRAEKLLSQFGEWDGKKFILARNIDDASDAEYAEFNILAPYHRILDHELHKKEVLEYLNKMLPNMPSDEKEPAATFHIYRCDSCHRHYPQWWISEKDWQNSFSGRAQNALDKIGFGVDGFYLYLCKECFEEIEQPCCPPKYFTVNQYVARRENKAEMKRFLSQIWDLPAT